MPAHLLPSGSNHGESGTLEAAAVKTESVTLEAKKCAEENRNSLIVVQMRRQLRIFLRG